MILEQCKGVHCVDLGESLQTHIYLQNLVSIQPRTSPLKVHVEVPCLTSSIVPAFSPAALSGDHADGFVPVAVPGAG